MPVYILIIPNFRSIFNLHPAQLIESVFVHINKKCFYTPMLFPAGGTRGLHLRRSEKNSPFQAEKTVCYIIKN